MQQPTDTPDLLADLSGTTVAADAMQSVFGMEPHAWQEQAMSHTIALAKDDTVGVILAGIVFTISPLLSLAADPTNKVDRRAS
jgi:hypothetical protein